jgi:sugar phosphate permease
VKLFPRRSATYRVASVFLPFATGYFLSYLFRTINGPIADRLVAAFHLDTASLGLLTSVYLVPRYWRWVATSSKRRQLHIELAGQ